MATNDLAAATAAALDAMADAVDRMRPLVEAHVTAERVLAYVRALADTPAPSTAASALRAPVLRELLAADGALGRNLALDPDWADTGSAVLTVGDPEPAQQLWYFAHLDTISYLVQPRAAGGFPLVPYCYHLTDDGERPARAYRYDLMSGRYAVVAEGRLVSTGGEPWFVPDDPDVMLGPGDRVTPWVRTQAAADGHLTGHFDNAGAVAALAVAAPVLAEAGVNALVAFPDEEEGPPGGGNQVMGRGGSRLIARMPAPDLAVVSDMQQAGGPDEDRSRLGEGAVLAEFSSLGRGSVAPPHLYGAARAFREIATARGVRLQESGNGYTSRSDDVSLTLRTPNILLLGFPGRDRHFDRAAPTANLADIVDLARALVYVSALAPLAALLRRRAGS